MATTAHKARRTPTEILVHHINLDKLEAEALAFVHEEGELRKAIAPDATECKAGFSPYGFVNTPKGLFALCSEGVGDGPITDEDPYVVSFYPRTSRSGWILPACEAKLGPSAIRELADGTTSNLAEFIRSFGARLDNNYESWRRTLESK